MKNLILVSTLLVLLTAFTYKTIIDYSIAKGYEIKFVGDSIEGQFEELDGTVSFDPNNLGSSFMDVAVDVASIATGNFLKNRHAKGQDWFDAQKYPKIAFQSNKFEKTKTGYQVLGLLTMHGIQNKVIIPFQFSDNKFIGSFSVNRLDYKIGTMEGMSKKVGNQIKIELKVPVVKKQ